MTEREQFEAFVLQETGISLRANVEAMTPGIGLAWRAWQAARAQPAQAVPVLTYEEIEAVLQQPIGDRKGNRLHIFAQAIEQAVRAKMGVAVPMTREQMKSLLTDHGYTNAPPQERAHFINGVRAGEHHHGIVGEKGGAT